ncbi:MULTISPECIES: 2-amino-4-hydroxy-6-hydroxymethyldihydropteridine diphosphokinase [Bacillus subtilis group]|uniref:2-amino-4-hydroxy-6- hydroxymethyldihydropteridine diphosphokinase n=1 Tax=Bacillus subtilis group TaxID=653685 RepID=UPI0009C39875|nr:MULTISPECIES: 2-amino-4-hydroxy-6-hydroxymethyldihydropteridine diphosphokinase [Bacillus subtilis group]ARC76565.1 hypothetical protein B37_04598 [Bacillus licheniformis]ARW52659.1 hypothetical protein S100027_00642 [Bacillus licheniformis]MEC1811000.1 2-amino-4-hydroxy-6-hydroxymethyldihydropteridine diphosphokinase [Bacillus licheniformis]MED4508075.1 2-amino-4-hydroxy-6-hydroxymethyldihydropteridine diphosphokinase [Bacillus licheniformis]TWJ84385.1 hypothetical protein CHCC20496_4387 [
MKDTNLKPIMPGVWGHFETDKSPEELKQGLKDIEQKLENWLAYWSNIRRESI